MWIENFFYFQKIVWSSHYGCLLGSCFMRTAKMYVYCMFSYAIDIYTDCVWIVVCAKANWWACATIYLLFFLHLFINIYIVYVGIEREVEAFLPTLNEQQNGFKHSSELYILANGNDNMLCFVAVCTANGVRLKCL